MRLSLLSLLFFSYFTLIFSGWIDPDTLPKDHQTISLENGETMDLIFSDEFNVANRRFADGDDPKWTALHKNDYTNYALHYYNESLIHTNNGFLNITTIAEDITFSYYDTKLHTFKKEKKYYQSGMLQGWNKFCFTNGIVEISAQLPGSHKIAGLWPALWLLGNLARATFVGSSNNVWPWSYDKCNSKIQSEQLISKCNKVNHYGLHSEQGRGAPEIDIVEAMAGEMHLMHTPVHRPYFSTSLQVAPGNTAYRPSNGWPPDLEQWYHNNITYGNNASVNIFFYGDQLKGTTEDKDYVTDAISANRDLSAEHFTSQHIYRMEWQSGPDGYIAWYINNEFIFRIGAPALELTGSILPEEPMYLLLNTALSYTWGFPDCPPGCNCKCYDSRDLTCGCALPNDMLLNFPAYFLIDYVRVYQNKNDPTHIVGCSTPSHPTRQFIQGHKGLYKESLQEDVLKPIKHGGGKCQKDNDCRPYPDYPRSFCDHHSHRCHCGSKSEAEKNGSAPSFPFYTGPNCLAAEGYDDIIYDVDEPLSFYEVLLPRSLLILLAGLLVGLVMVVIAKYLEDKKVRGVVRAMSYDGYTSVPDQELGVEQEAKDGGIRNDVNGSVIRDSYQQQ